MRRAARKDALHREVGRAFELDGWSMIDLSPLGDGKPDWLAARAAFCLLIEVKTPGWERPGSETQARQQKFREGWKGCPVLVIETLAQAWEELPVWRKRATA